MRLLEHTSNGAFRLVSFNDEDPPPYAILSHTWTEGQEVTYHDVVKGTGEDKSGYDKIRFCSRRAAADGLQYFWVDTCCINKSISHELSTAINSMFRWYQRASKCYVYLSDVLVPEEIADAEAYPITWAEAFRRSRWFTRGWTLQELLAPPYVEFFSRNSKRLGSRISLEQQIHEITEIATAALRGHSLADFSIRERMSWAAQRTTTMKEDKVYCLLGIFEIFLPLIYGEGEAYATLRLREELERRLRSQGTGRPLDLLRLSVSPFPRDEPLIEREYQEPEDRRKRKRQDSLAGQSKRYCQSLQRDIPPQVLLASPIILFDGFDKCFAFSLDWISSLNSFRGLMARKAREVLEDRFKEKGFAKIWEGDFLLQDQSRRNLDLRRPWNYIMKPGEQRYMSIKFRENIGMQTSCPHCRTENTALEGQATFCQSCQVTYERVLDLDEEDATEDRTSSNSPPEVLSNGPPRHDVTDEDLKYCFRRIVLTAQAPQTSDLDSMICFDGDADLRAGREVDLIGFDVYVDGKASREVDLIGFDGDVDGKAGREVDQICRDCGQAFRTPGMMNKHYNRMHRLRYRCDICVRPFGIKADLERHEHTAHPELFPSTKRFRCTLPGCKTPTQEWKRKDNFTRHIRSCEARAAARVAGANGGSGKEKERALDMG